MFSFILLVYWSVSFVKDDFQEKQGLEKGAEQLLKTQLAASAIQLLTFSARHV
jgi:hypothetical protein